MTATGSPRRRKAPAPVLDLPSLLGSWELALRAERKSVQTVRSYADSVRRFLLWCERTERPPELSKRAVSEFVVELLDGGAQATTAKTWHFGLTRFSRWLFEEGETDEDVLAGSKAPQLDEKVTQSLTDDQLVAMIKACQGKALFERRDEALVRLMAETAMRSAEAVALQLADVDLTRGLVVVQRGKGGRGRIVPIGPATCRALDRYIRVRRTHRLADSGQLWLGEGGKGFGYAALYRTLCRRATAAGIEGFHPHVLRHTGAARWLAAGGSEGGLMAVAGWKRRDMVDRYTRATAAERAADEARTLGLGEL